MELFQEKFLRNIVALGMLKKVDIIGGQEVQAAYYRNIVFYVLNRKFKLDNDLISEMFGCTAETVRLGMRKVNIRQDAEMVADVCRDISIGGYYGVTGVKTIPEAVLDIVRILAREQGIVA